MRQVPELADLPVIFISAYRRDETVARALESGAADYIVKPFSPTELVARVRAGLRRREAPEPFAVGDLAIDYGRRRVTVGGEAVELGEAVRLRRVGLLDRVRLQPPPVVVERDLPVVSDTLEEPVERIRQTRLQLLDRRGGIHGEPGSRPERFADLLPPRGGQEERLEPAEVLRAVDGEVAGLDLVADLEGTTRSPSGGGPSRRHGG